MLYETAPIVELIKKAPGSQIDQAMVLLAGMWSEPPLAIEVLEVLDYCVHGGLASQVAMLALGAIYEEALQRENTTREEVIKLARWRDQ